MYRVHLGSIADDDDAWRVGEGKRRCRGHGDAGLFAGRFGHEGHGLDGFEHEQKHQHCGQRPGRGLGQRYLEGDTSEGQQGEQLGEQQAGFLAGRMRDAQPERRRGQLGRVERIGSRGCAQDIGGEGRQPDAEGAPQAEARGWGNVHLRGYGCSCCRLAGKAYSFVAPSLRGQL